MTPSDLAAAIERLDREASKGPWFVVGAPWGDETYAVDKAPDPHVGRPVLQWVEVDEATETDTETVEQVWGRVEHEMRTNLALSVALRNHAALIVAALRLAEAACRYQDVAENEEGGARADECVDSEIAYRRAARAALKVKET